MKVNFKEILHEVAVDFTTSDPYNMTFGVEYLLSRGEDFELDGYIEGHITNTIDFSDIQISKADYYMLLLMHKLLLEADQNEIDAILDFIRKYYFVNSLLKTDFDIYRKRIRGKRIKRILDLRATSQTSSVVVLDSVDKYHYVPMIEHDAIHKYIDFCSKVRTEPVEIASKTMAEALSNVSNKEYDCVIVDDDVLDNEEIKNKIQSIGFNHVICFSYGFAFEFLDPSDLEY